MPIDPGGYKSYIGISDLYYALITTDSAAAYTPGVPTLLAPVAEISQEPNVSSETQYADNTAFDTASGEGETVVTITITNLPLETQAILLGRVLDAVTGRMYDQGGTPPYVALGFRSLKSNGKYRYYWFLKGKFELPGEAAKTKTDTVEFQPVELTFTGIFSTFEFTVGPGAVKAKTKRVVGDEDVPNFSGATWFDAVQFPAYAAPAALTLSVADPLDGAAGVVVTKTIALTFSNALMDDAINGVVVVKADGTPVVCTNSLDATSKIMTVNPDASLDASSTYIVAIGVIDIYGQALNTAINFGTA
jgi:phi13 family phage major tail protein